MSDQLNQGRWINEVYTMTCGCKQYRSAEAVAAGQTHVWINEPCDECNARGVLGRAWL